MPIHPLRAQLQHHAFVQGRSASLGAWEGRQGAGAQNGGTLLVAQGLQRHVAMARGQLSRWPQEMGKLRCKDDQRCGLLQKNR